MLNTIRSANIALIQYEDGEKAYIIAPIGLTDGDVVVSGEGADIKPGNALFIKDIPVGTLIHNIELYPGKGAQLVRSAGNSAQLMAKEGDYAQVRLPSGEVRMIRLDCKATIGVVGNQQHENVSIGKAGRKRHMGWRPTVRGVVMNQSVVLHRLLLGVNQHLVLRQERLRTELTSSSLREETLNNRYLILI